LNVPQAAGPVAFSLVALTLTGDTSGGAAIILAMTLAQVVGAVPVTRLGRSLPATTYLRSLVVFRTLALASMAACAHFEAPFAWLVPIAALAGSVNAAAYGYMRSVLNQLAPSSRLPRALGIASTLNELTFVLAPVMASGLGTISPIFGLVALTALGAVPALALPRVRLSSSQETAHVEGSLLRPAIAMWLTCAIAGGATVASIEIGAVALALNFGYEPALAILFTVPLCIASVGGGMWVSVRNRMASQKIVVAQLSVMTLGSLLAALQISLAMTILGAVLIGCVLAPLGTYYALVLDTLAPPRKRPEVFALLRTSNALGIILASAMLTMASLSSALIVVTGVMCVVTAGVAASAFPASRRR
jgi:hypothetical protein